MIMKEGEQSIQGKSQTLNLFSHRKYGILQAYIRNTHMDHILPTADLWRGVDSHQEGHREIISVFHVKVGDLSTLAGSTFLIQK